MHELLVAQTRPAARLPTKAHPTDIGWDLYAYALNDKGVSRTINVGSRMSRRIPTGLIVVPPEGFYLQVLSRSGLASRAVFVANAPGLIDPGYRGELEVILFNGSHEACLIAHEDRIAQLILLPILSSTIVKAEVKDLPSGERGTAGFGSSGR